ncbi:apoptosis-associated speck-like protein containing a CARD isoform X1 [Pelobates fuscus]|uniref:apoptosis-associated speck-like protein containing a CARD isoform X1 n=1 Tax=Pelobates fuscus TaxID=191477 RepID=UPI002FE492CF
MSFTVRDVLVRNLEELGERNFKRFRTKLNEFPVEGPYRSIPKARLEKADEDDVADLILAAYSNPYGVTVTLEVLRQINQNQIAEKLEQDLEKASNYKKPSNGDKPAGMMGTQRADTAAEHFVDRRRAELISRMGLVDPVLDDLLSRKLLTDEHYSIVRSKATSQDKMRELYGFSRSWGVGDKDAFYQILRKHNEPLIIDLERS